MITKKGFSTYGGGGGFFINPLKTEDVTAYIKRLGWKKVNHPNKSILLYEGPDDDFGNPLKVVLPVSKDFSDADVRISQAVETIATVENKLVPDVCQAMRMRGWDILKQRIYNSSRLDSIALELAPKIIGSLRNIVYYSACAEEDAQPYFYKGRKIGLDYTKKCRFGHTFHGSFGLSIEMPIPPRVQASLDESLVQYPLERRIMERIIYGLHCVQKSALEGDIGVLVDNFEKGFNANLCESLIEISNNLEDCNINFSVAWSSEYSVPASLHGVTDININPQLVIPYLESAAKALRKAKESEEAEVIGLITQLRANSLDEEDSGELESNKEITVSWEIENGKKVYIHVILGLDEYKVACDAHRDGKKISIHGRPEKQGKFWFLTAPKNFTILG